MNLPLLLERHGGGLGEVLLQEGDILVLGNFSFMVAHPLLELNEEIP